MVDNSDDEQDHDIWDMVGNNQDAPNINSDQSSIVTPRFDDSNVPTLESSSRSSRDISTVITESMICLTSKMTMITVKQLHLTMMTIAIIISALIATIYDGNPEPKHYLEARTSPDSSNLWEAMCTEIKNMESKEVLQISPKTEVPTNHKIIGARWVYAKKDDGRYHARCVAKGFSQIPG
jgi:Reverse transcriptase (RNA-dependent DNA polymerase)